MRISSWLGLIALALFFSASSKAETTNALSAAETEGQQLAQRLRELQPTGNFTNTGVLRIRDGKGKRTEHPIKFEVIVSTTNWVTTYEISQTNSITQTPAIQKLCVYHESEKSNRYELIHDVVLYREKDDGHIRHDADLTRLTRNSSIASDEASFAGDFGASDLGLEFLNWPRQKALKHEMKKGQACTVLESSIPTSSTNSYSRVVSWIDNDTGGIVHADAYDAKGKLLKVFEPKKFKKVNGQWQLCEMEMRNVQTDSRTLIKFDLEAE